MNFPAEGRDCFERLPHATSYRDNTDVVVEQRWPGSAASAGRCRPISRSGTRMPRNSGTRRRPGSTATSWWPRTPSGRRYRRDVLLLRTPRDVDLKRVGDLHFRSRATAYAGILPVSALTFGGPEAMGEWWTERWRWERDTHRMTVAVDGDELLGFTYLGPSEEAGVRQLDAIHVDPARIGAGVGKLLMTDALPHLKPRAVLWVLAGNERAQRFYEKGGWHADGVTRMAAMSGIETLQLRYALDS